MDDVEKLAREAEGVSINMTDKQLRRVGGELAHGVVSRLAVIFFLGLGIVFMISGAFDLITLPRDDTDTAQRASGMKVRKDALTGCEYLETASGGFGPRMSRNGKQICR